jgi:nitrile hydratase accessory protein
MSADRLKELVAQGVVKAEHTFSAPWEARAFAIAVGLSERGLCQWEEFRERLIEEVRAGDRAIAAGSDAGEQPYYEHFLRALERLLADKEIVMPRDLADKLRELDPSRE